jgi:hypothetical protein
MVSGLPRLHSGIGARVERASSVYAPGPVTSRAVMYLPPIPRGTNMMRRQTPFSWVETPPTVAVMGGPSAVGTATKTSAKRTPRASM